MATDPGWYPDPDDPSRARYWDGEAWTDRTRPAPGAEGERPAPAPDTRISERAATPPAAPAGGRAWWRRRIVLIAIAAIVLAGAGAFLLTSGSDDADAEVILEPTAAMGEDPFTDSVAKSDVKVKSGGVKQVSGGGSSIESVTGSAPGLYGGTGDQAACDADAMVAFLERNPDKASAFAGVLGIRPAAIEAYVAKLTPLVLREDTRVTNHGFSGGRATSLQSVLQAGTAVLVDDRGVPRVRCACGNPLTEPAAVSSTPEYSGDRWDDFDDQRLVAVSRSRTVVKQFVVVNVRTGESYRVGAGGGEQIVMGSNGLLARIGDLEVTPGTTTVQDMTQVFGSGVEVNDVAATGCVATWSDPEVNAYTTPTTGSCGPENPIYVMRIASNRYATEEGLRVGMTEADVKRLYPDAEFLPEFQDHPGGLAAETSEAYRLVSARDITGGQAPTLTAALKGGRVEVLSVALALLD